MANNLAVFWVLLVIFMAGCSSEFYPANEVQKWTYSQLRLYDPPDTTLPVNDIIAVYTRESSSKTEIRLDFLLDQPNVDHDLYITVDILPGSHPKGENIFPDSDLAWEYLLIQKSNQAPLILDRAGQLMTAPSLSTYRDSESGAIIFKLENLPGENIHNNFAIQAFVTNHDSLAPVEKTSVAYLNGFPPPDRAHLLLAFWNSLPSKTPAQTLRRWNGAHTGPYGQRHGLSHLLKSGEQFKIPLVLLDLKTPAGLAGLEYIGQMDQIRILEAQGDLFLPSVSIGDPNTSNISLNINESWSFNYGLRHSQFAFGQFQYAKLPPYGALFADLPDKQHIQTYRGRRLIPIPAPVYPSGDLPSLDQVDHFGLTVDAKKLLVNAALSNDPSRLVVFGGSLPETAWGDSSVAPIAFSYLESHPWIHPLTQEDLLSFPTIKEDIKTPPCNDLLCTPQFPDIFIAEGQSFDQHLTQIRVQLKTIPKNPILSLAWLAYFNFTSAVSDPNIYALRSNYITRLDHLQMAAQWAASPTSQSICKNGLCILSTESTFCVISQQGARLLLAISLIDGELRQWVAPFSQLAIGLSDPGNWRLDLNEASDPDEIPGAFSDLPEPFSFCSSSIKPGRITFDCEANGIIKTYDLLAESLEVTYISTTPISTNVPLVFLPLNNYSQDCEVPQHPALITNRTAQIIQSSYCDSQLKMNKPEDPDTNYPPGHFLPFPLTVKTIKAPAGYFSVRFNFR